MKPKDDHDNLASQWVVVDCLFCKREVRIRAGSRLSKLACPYCNKPLGEDKDSHQPSTSSVTKKPGPNSYPQRQRRVTAKNTPIWDSNPESPTMSGQDDTTEFLEIDPNNRSQMRKRRVRRKGHLRPWQKAKRLLLYSLLIIIGIASVSLFTFLVFRGEKTVTTDLIKPEIPDPKIPEVSSPYPASEIRGASDTRQSLALNKKSENEIPASITGEERDVCLKIIHSFAAAKTTEEKMVLVAHPEITGERMKRKRLHPENETYSEIIDSNKLRLESGKFAILLAVRIGNLDQQRYFAFIQSSRDDIKMHWEVSFGYQPMPLGLFKKTQPVQAHPFRAKLRNGDFFANDFDDKKRWYCVEVYYPGNPDFLIYGYLDRQTPFGQSVIARLDHSENIIPGLPAIETTLSVIASMRFPQNPASNNQVEIVDIPSYSWFE